MTAAGAVEPNPAIEREERQPMRLGVLTSTETRHCYFARALSRGLPVVAVGYEQTGYSPAEVESFGLTDEERGIVRAHFDERTATEQDFFGADADAIGPSSETDSRQLTTGTLNDPSTLGWLRDRRVDALAVFGTNLLRAPLLAAFPGRVFNLHLGLSPYYRGTGTNFYPLLNEEPEYVGATIHLIDPGIDSGPIICHARPTIVAGDRPHTIGCKAIRAGIDAMINVLQGVAAGGRPRATPQWRPEHARLYLRRDYHARQVVELCRKWDRGLLDTYLERVGREPPSIRLLAVEWTDDCVGGVPDNGGGIPAGSGERSRFGLIGPCSGEAAC